MTMAIPVQREVVLPPAPPANGNGAGTVHPDVVQAAVQAADVEAERKLAAIAQLGRAIKFKERELAKQETSVAEAESALKKEREARNKIQHEIDDAKNELVLLSMGKSSERLPFKDPAMSEAAATPAADPNKTQEQALQDAFDALPLSEIGVKSNLADKLVSDGIRYGKDLREWFATVPQRKVPGVGPKAVEQLNELMAEKMIAMKREADAQAKPAAPEAPFDDAAIQEDTIEKVIGSAGFYSIEVAQRAGGRWAARYMAQFGTHRLQSVSTTDKAVVDWVGNYANRIHAIAESSDAIFDFIGNTQNQKKLSPKTAKKAKEILRALDRLDKKLAADVKADGVAQDVKDFWEQREKETAEEAVMA